MKTEGKSRIVINFHLNNRFEKMEPLHTKKREKRENKMKKKKEKKKNEKVVK